MKYNLYFKNANVRQFVIVFPSRSYRNLAILQAKLSYTEQLKIRNTNNNNNYPSMLAE